jgi:hypothetical protein
MMAVAFVGPALYITGAGWSSPVARQAHNLKVVGSNPTPATIFIAPLLRLWLLRVPATLLSRNPLLPPNKKCFFAS